jgi:hypothetical protein
MRRVVAALAVPALVIPLVLSGAWGALPGSRPARAQEEDPAAAHRKALAPLARLAGSFRFARPDGYEKTFENRLENGGTVLLWRSRTVVPGGEVVYEDICVVSYDAAKKRLRARQWAHGWCSTFDVAAQEGGSIVMTEVETEGEKPSPWRYTIDASDDGFRYRVERRAGGEWAPYIGHEVKRVPVAR